MDSKNLILCCIIVTVGVAAICCALILNQGDETWMNVMSEGSIDDGGEFKLSLNALNGSQLSDKIVKIIIIDSEGKNTVLNSTTDSEGIATFTISGLNPGNYTVECIFDGGEGYKSVKITTPLEIKEQVAAVESQEKGTFGVCYYCQKQVDGSWGKVICAECEANKANGFKDPIPDNGGWWSEAYICGPNPGDGSKAWMYNNYHYL